jgi:hypothetical protein
VPVVRKEGKGLKRKQTTHTKGEHTMSENTTETTEAMDFNLENDFTEEPLIPQGNYKGSVVEVKLDLEKHSINWAIVLNDNSAVMSDGETDVNGVRVYFRNWLPKPGDDQELTSTGKMTKAQSKINQLAKFAKNMRFNMNTMSTIKENIDNQEWIGTDVIVSIGISEYQGNVRNDVSKMALGAF